MADKWKSMGVWHAPVICIAVGFIVLFNMLSLAADRTAGSLPSIRIAGTGAALGGMNCVADAFVEQHPDAGFTIDVLPSLGSGGGIQALLEDAVDIAVSSRPLKSDEAAKGAEARHYASTTVGFVTHPGTPIDNLTLDDLQDIYAGRMSHWPDGSDVRLVLRAANESDVLMLRKLSPALDHAVDQAYARPGLFIATNDQENAQVIERLPGGFGMMTVAQMVSERRRVRLVPLNGTDPAAPAGDVEHYPLKRDFWIITRTPWRQRTGRFVDFVQSPAARAVLRACGHRPPGGA